MANCCGVPMVRFTESKFKDKPLWHSTGEFTAEQKANFIICPTCENMLEDLTRAVSKALFDAGLDVILDSKDVN